jgi:hypothetical protein
MGTAEAPNSTNKDSEIPDHSPLLFRIAIPVNPNPRRSAVEGSGIGPKATPPLK